MVIHDIQQNTPEWDALRAGKLTGSVANDLLMKESTKGYKKLIKRVAFERLTGKQAESWQGNSWTDRGRELEPYARDYYEQETFQKVNQVGFVELDEWTGCSPDGLIGKNKQIQIKCFGHSAHIDLLMKKKISTAYYRQVQFELYCTKRESSVFLAWHPELKPFELVIKPDETQKEIAIRLEVAKQQVLELMDKIK